MTKEELKTLNDMELFAPDDPYTTMEPMNKTTDKRTLNSNWYNDAKKRHVWINKDTSRQEAIKHIKRLRIEIKEHKDCDDHINCNYWHEVRDDEYYSFCNATNVLKSKIDWIMNFFNIIEEDLKDDNKIVTPKHKHILNMATS